MSIRIDITSAYATLMSLGKWLNLYEEEILKYIFKKRSSYSLQDFIEYFNIKEETILKDSLEVASLHVTTNNDKCKSIKELGLMNLQESIKGDTPLGNYLKEQGVIIHIYNKLIQFKGTTYDLSQEDSNAYPGSQGSKRNSVIRKLYKDYQINGFLCTRNALNYGGGVSYRPEILSTLSEMLGTEEIERNWITQKNKCYILKYYADISEYTHYTFDVKVYNEEDYDENKEEYELVKRKWLLGRALAVLFDDMFNHSLPEEYSYANFEVLIPSKDIKIYTKDDYIKEYKIEG